MARASDLGLARSVEGEAEVLFPADTKNLFGKFVLCGTPCPRPPSYPQASFRGIRKLALSRLPHVPLPVNLNRRTGYRLSAIV